MTLPLDPWLRALRAFVIVAGIAILAGVGILVWLLFQRSQDRAVTDPAAVSTPIAGSPAQPVTPAAPLAPVLADLHLPAGSAIIDIRVTPERIVLLIRTADEQDYLAVVDAATGERRMLLRVVTDQR